MKKEREEGLLTNAARCGQPPLKNWGRGGKEEERRLSGFVPQFIFPIGR